MAYNKNLNIGPNNVVNISGSKITVTGSLTGSEFSGSRLQSTIVSASNLFAGGILYPTADGDAGQVMVTDGLGTLTFQDPVANDLIIRVKNREVTTILKGTPCYITSSGTSGNIAGILRADANNPARMPAACIAFEDILADTEGLAILEGFINGVNTNGFASGEAVYVAVGGGYTNIRPTGSALVQPLGYIEKVGTNGSGVVKGPGHHYIVPNITANHIWVGDANGVPVELNRQVFATTGSNTFVGNQIISGNLTVTGTISGTVGQFTSLTASTSNITTLTSSNALFLNNIQVNGTASIAQLNTVNQQSLFIGDKYITILSGAADHANLNGSGILWGSGAFAEPTQNELGSHAHVRYRLSNDTLEIFPGLTVGSGSSFVLITSSSISASQYIGPVLTASAGSTHQIQFNTGSNVLGADSTFVWDNTNKRLGVGTASPTYKLDISANTAGGVANFSNANASGYAAADFTLAGTQRFSTGYCGAAQGLLQNNAYFYSQNSDLMIMVQDTSATSQRPSVTFKSAETVFNDNAQNINFRVESNSSQNMLLVDSALNRVGVNKTSPNSTLDVNGSTIISGNLTVTGSIAELSTRRIKTNIVSLNDELTTISKLNPVSYTRIDDGRREYGFISEEVKEVYPEFVVGEGINYPKMVSILVSAVKELTEKVENQSKEIQLLKNKKKKTIRGKK